MRRSLAENRYYRGKLHSFQPDKFRLHSFQVHIEIQEIQLF